VFAHDSLEHVQKKTIQHHRGNISPEQGRSSQHIPTLDVEHEEQNKAMKTPINSGISVFLKKSF